MNSYKMSPCKDCKNRCIGCHGKCELYHAWKKEESRIHMKVMAKTHIGGLGYYHD